MHGSMRRREETRPVGKTVRPRRLPPTLPRPGQCPDARSACKAQARRVVARAVTHRPPLIFAFPLTREVSRRDHEVNAMQAQNWYELERTVPGHMSSPPNAVQPSSSPITRLCDPTRGGLPDS
jgi:hypothetical protein